MIDKLTKRDLDLCLHGLSQSLLKNNRVIRKFVGPDIPFDDINPENYDESNKYILEGCLKKRNQISHV